MKGVYCLIIFLDKDRKIRVGKRRILFKKGFYCYVGSALNSLEKRLERHFSRNKKKRWHIDYFLHYTKILGVKKIITDKKIECLLSRKIQKLSSSQIPKFGSSDCSCETHLYYFIKNPLSKQDFKEIWK